MFPPIFVLKLSVDKAKVPKQNHPRECVCVLVSRLRGFKL
jgi:hypothetical protein